MHEILRFKNKYFRYKEEADNRIKNVLEPVFSYLGYSYGDFPQAEKASREVLSLPMHPFLSEQEQDRIVDALKVN